MSKTRSRRSRNKPKTLSGRRFETVIIDEPVSAELTTEQVRERSRAEVTRAVNNYLITRAAKQPLTVELSMMVDLPREGVVLSGGHAATRRTTTPPFPVGARVVVIKTGAVGTVKEDRPKNGGCLVEFVGIQTPGGFHYSELEPETVEEVSS